MPNTQTIDAMPGTNTLDTAENIIKHTIYRIFRKLLLAIITEKDVSLKEVQDCALRSDEHRLKKAVPI